MRVWVMVLLLVAPAAAGQVFKWTDADGRVHYGDKPPAQTEGQPVDMDKAPLSTPGPAVAPVLRPTEREMLRKIEAQEQREAKERASEARRLERENRRQAKAEERQRSQCAAYRSRYEAVTERLRAGYTAAQGDALHRRAEGYAAKIKEYCR